MIDDLIIRRPQERSLNLVRITKDAEACSICGGSRPMLFWNGYSMVHDECARAAKAASKIKVEPQERMSVDQFMTKLAANEKLIRRLFGHARH